MLSLQFMYWYTVHLLMCMCHTCVNMPLVYIGHIILYYVMLCCIILYYIIWYCIVLYCIVLYCIVLYCIVLYCIVLCYIKLHCMVSVYIYSGDEDMILRLNNTFSDYDATFYLFRMYVPVNWLMCSTFYVICNMCCVFCFSHGSCGLLNLYLK